MNTSLSTAQWKSISNVNWSKHVEKIENFLTKKEYTYEPKMVKKFGKDNFKMHMGRLYLFKREIVIEDKRLKEILNKEEGKYGGTKKAYARVMRDYINVTRNRLREFYGGSERRQLKAGHKVSTKNVTFIHAATPGNLQIDLTFYRGAKLPIFGAVDVFSRWAYYERVPDKEAAKVIVAVKNCIREFEKVSKHRVYNLSSDAGSEFIHKTTKAWLTKSHIHYDQKAKSRKLIESLNRTLRLYVERIGWDTIKELDKLVEEFTRDYNNTRHTSTKKVPNELVAIDKQSTKPESKRQFKEKKVKTDKSVGWNRAPIVVGDSVRIYDPRRREIKTVQKEKLKGKVKLSEKDYVKQYTSHHRGNTAHWTKKVYKVSKIVTGTRAPRYRVEGKSDVYLRSELQKVRAVKKLDPRAKVVAARKKAAADKAKEPPPPRMSKLIRREIIVKFKDEDEARENDSGTILQVYKNYGITLFTSKMLSFVSHEEIVRVLPKRHTPADVALWISENRERVNNTKKEIDEDIKNIKELEQAES